VADRLNIEIDPRLVPLLLRLAQAQGRPPNKIIEEALLRYLRGLEPAPHLDDEFQDLLDRMSSRFDLDEDEAMRLAVEEQKAIRRERSGSERT
jgi:predicted transcriptional regulator